jgi:hypothetical protein
MPTKQVPSTATKPQSSTTKRLRAHRLARFYPRQVLLRLDHTPWLELNAAEQHAARWAAVTPTVLPVVGRDGAPFVLAKAG